VGLCFAEFLFVFGTSRWVAFGDPITLRAADFTAFVAKNLFLLFFLGIPGDSNLFR
jgi:hypothetical protein